MKVGSFYPHVWLGNEHRGFQWWADSDKGWFPDDDVPAHEVAREGGAVVLKNHVIGKPVEPTGPRTLNFTWIASPFKPLPKGWRMIAATDDGTFAVPHRGTRINPKTGKKYLESGIANWINPESYDPAEWGALWAVQDRHGLNPGAVGCHSTQAYIFPALPWIDAVLDGERDWNMDVSDMDWVDYYPKERMRAMSVPHTWGVGICWMSNFASADPRKKIAAKTAHAEYVWLHDSWINPYLDYSHLTRMPPGILDWGLNGADVAYVPYWRNPHAAVGDPDLLVSLWRIPGEADGRILVGVFNYNRRAAKDVEVKLDLAKLGLAGEPLDLRDFWRDFLLGYADAGIKAALALTNPQLGSAAEFDAAKGVLRIKGLGAHRGRYVGICPTSRMRKPSPSSGCRAAWNAPSPGLCIPATRRRAAIAPRRAGAALRKRSRHCRGSSASRRAGCRSSRIQDCRSSARMAGH